MKVQCTKRFINYAAADAWIEANGYDQPVIVIAESGATTVTLEGAHAVRAIEADAKAKVVVREAAQP
jgi:hypothetical protein